MMTDQPLLIKMWNLFSSQKTVGHAFLLDDVLNAARKRSGLSDFGDTDFLTGLDVFLNSASQADGFHAFGQFYLRQLIIAMLVHRLKLVDLLRMQPEILSERIDCPVFVLGLPRSGTTLLFNLLTQDPAFRYMANWEAFIAQVPPKGQYTHASDPRRNQAKWMLRFQKHLMPELDTLHEFSAEGSEECTPILMQSFATQAMAGGFDVPAFSRWLDDADHEPTYRHHQRVLQALQWKYPGKHWLLKSPDHLSALDSILKRYPDARFIHIHRNPAQSVSSWASLNLVYRKNYYTHIDIDALGAQVLERLANDVDRYMKERERTHPGQIYDIHYHDLIANPVSRIQDAYDHFNIDLCHDTKEKMRAFLLENPQNKHGAHLYQPNDFGLTENTILQRFEKYIDMFQIAVQVN